MANNKLFVGLRFLLLFPLLWISLAEAAGYDRNWIEVRVVDKHSGNAVEAAAVCVGTSADPEQFGARRTDAGGTVRFSDLLSHSVVVTASKKGYQGSERRLERLTRASVVVLKIVPGGGGPRCEAPAAGAQEAAPAELEIEGVSIRKDPEQSGRILLSIKLSGAASQVRISEQADFSDVQWRKLEQPLAFELSQGGGTKQLYVQLRRHLETEGASMEVTSAVRRVRYRR
ncbi:MAG: carboxypeptidase-like regulatory domain-containing protein [Gammaproteobacteria bacterium]|jgi:hypothetical protein